MPENIKSGKRAASRLFSGEGVEHPGGDALLFSVLPQHCKMIMKRLIWPRTTTRVSTSHPLRRYSTPSNPTTSSASAAPPTVATSSFMKHSREAALTTSGLVWRDEDEVAVGPLGNKGTKPAPDDLRDVEQGGRETKRMKSVE